MTFKLFSGHKTKTTMFMLLVLIFHVAISSINAATASITEDTTDTDLVDFEFDNDYSQFDASKSSIDRSDSIDNIEMIGDHQRNRNKESTMSAANIFAAKEKRIRVALQRATKDQIYTKKFAQILPIIRALNRQQRMVLASLIQAQAGASSGAGLNLAQVIYFIRFYIIFRLFRTNTYYLSYKNIALCPTSGYRS